MLLPTEGSSKTSAVRSSGARRPWCDRPRIDRRAEGQQRCRHHCTEHRNLGGRLSVDNCEDNKQDGDDADECGRVASNIQATWV
ncbi:hypothetical protein ASG84_14315 [Rhodococcus sp. Leaf278]|nr:hypothetical protein ASG84_14315 [Rhodococcus sp. Leaf278]